MKSLKKKMGVIVSALALLFGVVLVQPSNASANDIQFKDVSTTNSHYESITNLVNSGVIHGYTLPDGTKEFKPNDEITRGQAAELFTKALNLPIPSNVNNVLQNYKDVYTNTYFASAIAATYAAGIFHGSNGYFNDGPLTREQMATAIAKALDLQDKGTNPGINLGNVSPSHKANVKLLAEYGLTNQLNDFRPHETVTRGQFATLLFKGIEVSNSPSSPSDNSGEPTTNPTSPFGGNTGTLTPPTEPSSGSSETPTQCTNDGATFTGYNSTVSFNPNFMSVADASQRAVNYGLNLDLSTVESSFNSVIANKCQVVQTGGVLFYFDNGANMAVAKWSAQIVFH